MLEEGLKFEILVSGVQCVFSTSLYHSVSTGMPGQSCI
jgi:hypothetical protein